MPVPLSLRALAPACLCALLGLTAIPASARTLPGLMHDHPKAETPKAHPDTSHHHAKPKVEPKTYTCPMHPQVRQDKPGSCPICHMALVAAKPGMRFTTHLDPATPAAAQPFWFSYRFKNPDGSAPDLVESHTKLSHLIVVSKDLSYFDHVHPEQVEAGKFMIQLSLPAAGDYVAYPDATPRDGANQVEQFHFTVSGPTTPAVALTPTPIETTVNSYTVRLVTEPANLAVGEAMLTFKITKDGQPATDLQPYLGAGGHLVILSQDTTQFLHAHPLEHTEEADKTSHGGDMGAMAGHDMDHNAGDSSTPGVVTFHTAFPIAGRYKAWGQFLTSAGVITAPFVFDVD